jgi:hypothetical protein
VFIVANLTETLINEVKRDISSFSDPGTKVDIWTGGKIQWMRDRKTYEAQLITSVGFPDILYKERQFSYESFLASSAMADLQHLAVSIGNQIPIIQDFIAAPAQEQSIDHPPTIHSCAEELLINQIESKSLPFGSTRVLFLHGNAGVGKTSLLRHITRLQADRYLRGESSTLLLYLDAQGKGLSQLEDVMARALQDLRAHFTYHSLASLTRLNCVVPIVDGFDELIGPSSAREAFSNLAQFLSQLDCKGAIITSSRSAFIDYRTLHEKATELALAQGLSYEIYPIELLNWPDDKIFKYAHIKLKDDENKIKSIRSLISSPAGELVKKPFFLSHICDILDEGGTVEGDRDLVTQVVNAALQRETSKLQDKRQNPILTADQHRLFCQAIADEMWVQERAELDLQTIRTIAELFAEQISLPTENARILEDRSIAHGLLKSTQGDPNKREFEHELFRFDFQAGRFAVTLLGDELDAKDYLLRREIPLDLASRVAAYRAFSKEELLFLLNRLSEVSQRSKNNPYAATNAGTVAAAILRRQTFIPEKANIFNLYFRSEKLAGFVLNKWTIKDITFERVDLDGAEFKDCILDNDLFVACRMTSKTSFSGTEVTPQMFAGIEDEGGREYYDPALIISVLEKAGALIPKDLVAPIKEKDARTIARAELAEKFLQHARTHFNMSEEDNWVQNRIKHQKENWAQIEKILRKHSLLIDVKTQKSGPSTPIWRLTVPPDVIQRARAMPDAARPELSAFWRDVEKIDQ